MSDTAGSKIAAIYSPATAWVFFSYAAMGSLVDLFFVFYGIPIFRTICHDLSGARPLPALTQAVLDGTWIFAALACAWPMVALWMVHRLKADFRFAKRYFSLFAGIYFLQIILPLIALYQPFRVSVRMLSSQH